MDRDVLRVFARPWAIDRLEVLRQPRTLYDRMLMFAADRLDADAVDVETGGIEIPANDDELWLLVRDLLGIEIPRNSVCPDHSAPFDAFASAYFARDRVGIWKAARGFGGKSLMLTALSQIEAITLGAKVNLLGGSGEQSQRVLAYMNGIELPGHFWDHPGAPVHLIRGGFERGLLSRKTMLTNGGAMHALLASQRSVRGPHPQRLRLDEIDEMPLPIFKAALGQTMGRDGIRGQTVGSSTHHNDDGTMAYALEQAAEKGWRVFEWCYRESLIENGGWLDPAEVEDKRIEMPTQMFMVEVELQEPNPEGRAIDTQSVNRMFTKRLGHYKGAAGEYIEIEPPLEGPVYAPVCTILEDDNSSGCGHLFEDYGQPPGFDPDKPEDALLRCPVCDRAREPGEYGEALYATGADWARSQDWTIIWTYRVDVKPKRVVAFERLGRQSWPSMVARLDVRLRRFPGPANHDATGLGDVINDYLEEPANGIWLSGKVRSEIISRYVQAVERGLIEAPYIEWAHRSHKYAKNEDLYGGGATTAHLPDDVCAAALGWKLADRYGVLGIG